jgi:PAS domain S-box-containing protein
MVAVAAVPIIGVWEIFRQDESPNLRTFRLIVVLAFGLFLAVLILLRERLTKARLQSDAKKLESLNNELVEMVRAVLRRADPRSFRSTDDSKYTSLLALVAVVMVPVIGIGEVLRQNENPSLQTFRLLVVLVFGLSLAVLAFLGERHTKASLKSDSKKLEALNSELVEMVRAILRRADPNTFRTTFVNKHVEDILGYPVESWLQDPSFWAQHLHPEDRERTLAISTKAIQERRNHDLEYRMIASDGRSIWLREIVNVIVENGVPTGLVGVSADISTHKEAEQSMTLFRKLIDGSTDAIEVLDPRTLHFLDINEKACRDLGYHRQEMLSMNVYDIDPTLDRSSHTCITEKFRGSGSVIMETLHRRIDGSTFPVEINVKYVPLDQGYVVAVVRDISARKRTEEALSTLSHRLIKEHEQERGRVAKELRDDLNQRMALLQIRLGQFEQEVPDLPSEAREQLHSIAEVATNVSFGIHKLSHQLHPSLLDLVGLVPSVKGLCREFSDQHSLKVEPEG